MLDSPAVQASDNSRQRQLRVGFVTQLLWDRYGAFWRDLVLGAGAEAVFPTSAQVVAALGRLEDAEIPSISFRLAAAQAAALVGCDVVVLPRLNPDHGSQRGSAQDRWVVDLPGAVSDVVPALDQVQAVAAYPDPDIETTAVLLLQRLISDRASVPRVWSRHRRAAQRQSEPHGTTRGSGSRDAARVLAAGDVTAVLSQPWLLTERLASHLFDVDERLVTQLGLEPARCRDEGWRVDERLVASDAEVIGAARMLSRRAGVGRLRFLLDEGSSSDAWLLRRLAQVSHKPVEAWPWQRALGAGVADDGTEGAVVDEAVIDYLVNLPVD